MIRIIILCLLSTLTAHAQFRCQEVKQTVKTYSGPAVNNNSRSDTADILHYHITLDLSGIANGLLQGSCEITFIPLINNLDKLNLDLLQLNTDSIFMNGNSLSYTHQGELLKVDLGNAFNSQDTLSLTVHYSGSPAEDNSGWGGFHSQSGYHYNLGVGFAADPHTFGRAWFPCFDNFVEHSTYSYTITTQSVHRAYCNGLENSQIINNDGNRVTEWIMSDPIPTYLASVAVSTYIDSTYNVNIPGGQILVQLISRQVHQQPMLSAFKHLDSNLLHFIDHFGDYRWQKVGYALTPKGAMEHATSIHFPISLINQGQVAAEDIMAHELAHHWWGNLITCETADDMWINEGMAEFCSHLFYEDIYGREKYMDVVLANAYNVINNAHVQDNGYRPIYAPPHQYVYGYHVYQKGAMAAHNLRAYLGSNLFFNSLTTLLNNNEFQNLSTQQFRDQLSQISGVNLNDFFDSWIYNEGFPSVAVQEFSSPSANSANIKLVQRKHQAPLIYKGLPVEVTFFSADGDTASRTLVMNGDSATANFQQLPFTPEFALASYSGKLLTADTYDEFELTQPRILSDKFGKMRLQVKSTTDTANVIVMHHYAGPAGEIPASSDFKISNSRYWTVKGWGFQNAIINATVSYDGTANGYDQDLVGQTEDSIMVLYRNDPQAQWTLYPHQKKGGAGGVFNGTGTIELEDIKAGEYVFANTSARIGFNEPIRGENIRIYPNPGKNEINIDFGNSKPGSYQVNITNTAGKSIYDHEHKISSSKPEVNISLPEVSQYVLVQVNGYTQKVLIE